MWSKIAKPVPLLSFPFLLVSSLDIYAQDQAQVGEVFAAYSENELQDDITNLDSTYTDRTFGLEYIFYDTEAYTLSFILDKGQLDVDYTGITKTLEADSTAVGFNMEYHNNGFEFQTLASMAQSDYKSVRTVTDPFGPNSITYTGKFDSDQRALFLKTGYAFDAGDFQVTPHLSWFYSDYRQDPYTETSSGNGGGNKMEPPQEVWNSRLSAGVTFTQEMELESGAVWEFFQTLRYTREYKDTAPNGSFSRQIPMAGNSFLVWTENAGKKPEGFPKQRTVEYQFGASFEPAPGVTMSFSYSGLSNDILSMDFYLASFALEF